MSYLRGFVVCCIATLSLAQSPDKTAAVSPSYQIDAVMDQDLNTKKAKVGDTFGLTTRDDSIYWLGPTEKRIIIPESAKLIGRVLMVEPHHRGRPARMSIIIEKALWLNRSLDLHARVDWLGIEPRELVKQAAPVVAPNIAAAPTQDSFSGGHLIGVSPDVRPTSGGPSPRLVDVLVDRPHISVRASSDPTIGTELYNNKSNFVLAKGQLVALSQEMAETRTSVPAEKR